MVRGLLLLLFLGLTACAPLAPATQVQRFQDAMLTADTVWRGSILIDGQVKVAKGVTLTIEPGTDIAFVRKDLNQDGLGDGTLIVEGRLLALGTRAQPIRFRSAAADPQPGDWLEIHSDFSKEIHLRYCEIRDSAYTLHAHFSRGIVEDCHIHHNIDGCRLGEATFTLRHNLIEHNQGKGINFRNATVDIHRNIIRRNGAGIFLFESNRSATIEQNNLYANRDNFRLGDFFTDDVRLGENWWGSADPQQAEATIFDRRQDPTIGGVTLNPGPAPVWIEGAGPRDALSLGQVWRVKTGGFVDATAVVAGDLAYLPGWDGQLYALTAKGEIRWQADLGAEADGTVALDEQSVYVQSWDRQVLALDRSSGAVRWRFSYLPSLADDHRQAGLLRVEDLLLVPAWNGTLYALDASSGSLRWQFATLGPLRAAPILDADRIYLAAGDGSLHALSLTGEPLWSVRFESPLLSVPALSAAGPVVVDRQGQLIAFDRNGAERWRRALGELCYYGAPLIDGEALFLATAGAGLWKIDLETGAVVWRQSLPHPSYATPLVHNGRLFVGDNGGLLTVIGRNSGEKLASFAAGGAIQGQVTPFAGRLLFGARDQQIYALELQPAP